MKKVAFFLCSDTIGGHEFQAIEMLLSAQEYCDTTLFLNVPQHLNLIKGNKIKYVESKKPFFINGNFISQFYYAIKHKSKIRELALEFDKIVICAGTAEAGICCGYALKGSNTYLYVPMFVDRKQLWGYIGGVYNCLISLFIYPFKAIITINRFQAKIFSKFKPVIVVPNKIEQHDVPSIVKSSSRPRLYFIGRLEKQKRLDQLLEWLDCPENKFADFTIVGTGSEKEKLETTIRSLKYINVALRNWLSREEQEKEFSSSDVFVINSFYEGEPLVIREANNRGSIVIARDITGSKGCTHWENRYSTQEELLRLLSLAYDGKLKRYSNQPTYEIELLREKSIKRIFI